MEVVEKPSLSNPFAIVRNRSSNFFPQVRSNEIKPLRHAMQSNKDIVQSFSRIKKKKANRNKNLEENFLESVGKKENNMHDIQHLERLAVSFLFVF